MSFNLQPDDYPTVMIGLFLEQPTPFIREFFERIAALNYPKNRIDLFIHNKVSGAVNIEDMNFLCFVNSFLNVKHSETVNSKIRYTVNIEEYIMDPHSRAPKKNTSHGSEVLPQDTTHLIQRPCYQRGSPCQDQAGNWTTWSPDDRKKTQTAVVWSCFPFIRSAKTILQGTVKGGRRQGGQRKRWEDNIREWTGLEFGPEGSGEQGKIEKTGCRIICGVLTTLAVKGLMMMMMIGFRCLETCVSPIFWIFRVSHEI